MNILNVPVAILRLQYRIARYPLQLVADTVMTRLDAEAPARLVYERSLGTVDAVVGEALGDVELQNKGAALAARSDALQRAVRLDTAADAKREKADEEWKAKRAEADTEQQEAGEAAADEIAAARKSAQQRTGQAAESVRKRTAAAKQSVDDVSDKRMNSVEQTRTNAKEAIRAEDKAATAAAQSTLDDVASKRGEAASRRAKAEQLDELADTEKARRRADRSGSDV